MTRRTPTLRIALASLCLAAATVPGCIEEDQLSAAIDEVSTSLELLAAPGTAIPGTKLRNDTYNNAISTLRPLVAGGSPQQKAAAWLLIARSELGLADGPLASAADARKELTDAVLGIRAELVAYRELAALAAAAESFDPTEEIAELQTKISDRVASAAEVREAMDAVRAEIAEFESLAEQALAAADEHRRAEASLRSEMLSMSAVDAQPIALQAAEQRSRADELAAESDRRAAQAEVLRPQITAFEGELDRLAEQQKLLEESIESLNAQREATAAEAADYRTRAGEIADRVTQAVNNADAYRTGPMQEAFDETVAALEAAAESAGKATASRKSSNLLRAEIMHKLGGASIAHASSLDKLAASVSEALNDAGIGGSSFAGVLSAIESDAAAARDRGNEALREARDGYQSAGVGGEGADRIDDVVASISAKLGESDDAPEAETEGE